MAYAKKILVPVDPSDQAPEALRLAHDMARAFGAELKVLAVLPRSKEPEGSGLDRDERGGIEGELWNRYIDFLLPERGPSAPFTAIRVRRGEPWREIVSMAGEMGAELIVMGTHGKKGWTRAAMGSVTEQVIRNAPCPVVALRTAGPAPAVWAGAEEASAHG